MIFFTLIFKNIIIIFKEIIAKQPVVTGLGDDTSEGEVSVCPVAVEDAVELPG